MEITQEHYFELFDYVRANSFKPALSSIVADKFKHLRLDITTLEIIIKLILENDTLANEILIIIIEKLNIKIEYNVKIEMVGTETQHKKNVIGKCFKYLNTCIKTIFLEPDIVITWSSSSIYPPKDNVQVTSDYPTPIIKSKSEGYVINGDILVKTPILSIFAADIKYKGKLELVHNRTLIIDFKEAEDLKTIFEFFSSFLHTSQLYSYIGIFAHFQFLNDVVAELLSERLESEETLNLIKNVDSLSKIQITEKEGNDDLSLDCEHNYAIEQYLNSNEITKDLNVFILNFFKVVGGMAYCKLCGQKIDSFLVFEYSEQTFLIPNENIIYKKPYSTYIGLEIFIDDFMFNFFNLCKINFSQYTPLIIMRLIEELEIISERRLQLEEEYKNKNIIPDFIFISRLNSKYFYINIREDSYYTNLRHYYTNIYIFYMIFALMSMEDYNNILRKLVIKSDKTFLMFMCRICSSFINRSNLNIFQDKKLHTRLETTFEIVASILSVQYSNLIESKSSKFIYFTQASEDILEPIDNKILLTPVINLDPIRIYTGKTDRHKIMTYFNKSRPIIRYEEDQKKLNVSVLETQKVNKKILETLRPLYDKVTYFYDNRQVTVKVEDNLIRLLSMKSTIVEVFFIGDVFNLEYTLPDDIDSKTVDLFNFFHKTDPYLFLEQFDEDVAFDNMEAFIREIEDYEDLTIWYPTTSLPITRETLTEFKLSLFNKEVEDFYDK